MPQVAIFFSLEFMPPPRSVNPGKTKQKTERKAKINAKTGEEETKEKKVFCYNPA